MGMLLTSLTLQNGSTTGNGNVADMSGQSEYVTLYCAGTGTISSGTITIEEAHTSTYSGTWSQLATVASTNISTAVQAVHLTGNYLFIRARISNNVSGGGNVTVTLVAD